MNGIAWHDLTAYRITMMVRLFSITTDNGPTKFYVGSYWIEGMLGVSDAGNGTVGSGERNGDGDENDAGSEISLLLLPGKKQSTFGLEYTE